MTVQDAYIARRCSEIDQLIQYAVIKSANDQELGAHLADYISVLINGVVEVTIEYFVAERARKTNDNHVFHYVQASVGAQFRNPKSEAIANVLKGFGEDYGKAYQTSVAKRSQEALGSVVARRISMAHEGTSQLNFTVGDVKNYFAQIVQLLEEVEKILL